jgi:hypothetical protein
MRRSVLYIGVIPTRSELSPKPPYTRKKNLRSNDREMGEKPSSPNLIVARCISSTSSSKFERNDWRPKDAKIGRTSSPDDVVQSSHSRRKIGFREIRYACLPLSRLLKTFKETNLLIAALCESCCRQAFPRRQLVGDDR